MLYKFSIEIIFERFLRTDEIRKDSSELSLIESFFFRNFKSYKLVNFKSLEFSGFEGIIFILILIVLLKYYLLISLKLIL